MALKGKANVLAAMDGLKASANNDVRKIYIRGLSNIIKLTPVDKGRAKNNWFLTLGMPSNKTAKASKSGGNSEAQAKMLPKDVLNNKVFFTNNLPYIGMLEFGGYKDGGTGKTSGGFSIQAPNGWVRGAVEEMKAKARAL